MKHIGILAHTASCTEIPMKLHGTAVMLAMLVAFSLVATADAQSERTGVHYLYLIRHGDYDDVENSDPVSALGLNALGREQARLVGERLAVLPLGPHALIASPYRRARETAEVMSPLLGLETVIDTLIHECTPATEREDIMRRESPEEIAACEANLEAAWRKYATASPDSNRRDVLVCHGNVIRWMVARALGEDPRNWLRMSIGNASITVLAVHADGSVRVASFSDTGHLPAERQTWTGSGAGWGDANRR